MSISGLPSATCPVEFAQFKLDPDQFLGPSSTGSVNFLVGVKQRGALWVSSWGTVRTHVWAELVLFVLQTPSYETTKVLVFALTTNPNRSFFDQL
jgi:hypothetical protein